MQVYFKTLSVLLDVLSLDNDILFVVMSKEILHAPSPMWVQFYEDYCKDQLQMQLYNNKF